MTDTRAVQTAYDELEQAIARVRESEDFASPGEVLTEFVVVTAHHSIDDDGDSVTAITQLHRDNMPIHRTLGLLDYAATRVRKTIATDD